MHAHTVQAWATSSVNSVTRAGTTTATFAKAQAAKRMHGALHATVEESSGVALAVALVACVAKGVVDLAA